MVILCGISIYYFSLFSHFYSIISLSPFHVDCEKINVPSLESVRHLILGSVYSNSGETTKARMHYVSALKEGELHGDIHTSAFASYELGMLLCKNYEVMLFGFLHNISLQHNNYSDFK